MTPLVVNAELILVKQTQILNNCFALGLQKDSTVIWLADCDPLEKLFHIYNMKDHSFIRSFGEKGKLYSEFNMPCFYQTNSVKVQRDSFIYLYDVNLLHHKRICLQKILENKEMAECITGEYLPRELYFTQNLNILNDSIIVGQSLDQNKGVFFIYNTRNEKMKWIQFNHSYRYSNKQYEHFSYLNKICANPEQGTIIVGYRFFDLIQIYNIQGELIKEM